MRRVAELSEAATQFDRFSLGEGFRIALKVRAETLRGHLIEIDNAINAAVSRGDLPDAAASPTVILAESRTARRDTKERLEAVRQRRAERPAVRESLMNQRQQHTANRATKVAERDQFTGDYRKLLTRVEELATEPRLAELSQLEAGGRLDLWAEASDLRPAFTHAATAAESAIVDTRVDAADDDRALDGLRADGFLPTTRDAQRAALAIATTGGIAARSGWDLLRDLVTESDRASVLKNAVVAELAAGVVVADADADKARLAVESHDWRSVAHVTVCTASQLQRALTDAAPEWLVIPSDPALFDPAAAENARAERELRRQEQDDRIAALHEQASADRALLRKLDALLHDCPAGHLHALETSIDQYRQAIEDIDSADEKLRTQIAELDSQDSADASTEENLTNELTLLAGAIERLTTLAEKVPSSRKPQRAIERFDHDVYTHTAIAEEAAALAKGYGNAERSARDRAAQHRANRERYERESREITLLDTERAAIVGGVGEPLSLLRSRFNDVDAQWRTVASQSVLAERLAGANELIRRSKKKLAAYPEVIRQRAAVLLETGDGQDPERRATARNRARQQAEGAQKTLTQAETEVEQAQQEVDKRTPRDRLRHAQLDVDPATEAEAREYAEAHAAQATEMSTKVTGLAREAEEAGKAVTEATKPPWYSPSKPTDSARPPLPQLYLMA